MKLLTKTSLLFLLASMVVFAAGIFIFQQHLNKILIEESEEILLSEKQQVLQFVEKNNRLPANELSIGDRLTAQLVQQKSTEKFGDTLIFSLAEQEMHPYRTLTFPAKIDDVNYSISILSPLLEKEELSETILTAFIYLILILLVAIVAITALLSHIVWKPFYKTIGILDRYTIGESIPKLPNTGTKEFLRLQVALEKMAVKIERDYREVKSFTENASHEMRTPLAILVTSIEQLLQGENLTEKQHDELNRLLLTIQRLNRLNQALLLLAKIENRQFDNTSITDLSELLRRKISHFSELANVKSITVKSSIADHVNTAIHPELADILAGNLMTNALRHTKESGEIIISLEPSGFSIRNSGDSPIQSPGRIFERFYKENPSSESTGLGLSIAKQITDSAGMKISYVFDKGYHRFLVEF